MELSLLTHIPFSTLLLEDDRTLVTYIDVVNKARRSGGG